MKLWSWPNVISAARIPLAGAFLIADSTPARAIIIIAAGLSDFIDGRLARGTGRSTRVGELLDPIADKLFVLVALGTFAWEGRLAVWQLLVLLARDLYTTAMFLVALAFRIPVRFRSRRGGKLVTTIQLAAMMVLLFRPGWIGPVVAVAAVVGAYAIIDYTRAAWISLRRDEGNE